MLRLLKKNRKTHNTTQRKKTRNSKKDAFTAFPTPTPSLSRDQNPFHSLLFPGKPMATKSQQILFHRACNKQKINPNIPVPSQISTTIITNGPNVKGFWENKLDQIEAEPEAEPEPPVVDADDDLPQLEEDEDEDEKRREPALAGGGLAGGAQKSPKSSVGSRRSASRRRRRRASRSRSHGGSVASARSKHSVSTRRSGKKRGGWTTIAPEDEDVAKEFYVERLRGIYNSKNKEFNVIKHHNMSLKNLRFKYNRLRTDEDVQSNVRMFGFMLFLLFFVVEKTVSYFIKSARVQGYSTKLSKSVYMKDFEKHLEKIIQRYFRSGTVNPWMGIFLTLIFTMTMYNFDPTFLDKPKNVQKLRNASSRPGQPKKEQSMPKPEYDSDSDLSEDDDTDASGPMSMVTDVLKNKKVLETFATILPKFLQNM